MVWNIALGGVFGQRFDGIGAPVGSEFHVNTYSIGSQDSPKVSPDGAGGFVVVWSSEGSSGSDASGRSIQGQRYDGTGTPVGGEFQVNTDTAGEQAEPDVSSDGADGFVVVWATEASSESDPSIPNVVQAQRYDGTGMPIGGEFRVNTRFSAFGNAHPAAFPNGAGGVVVAWGSLWSSGLDSSGTSVLAQRFGQCSNAAEPCDDGNGCTTDDVCGDGVCAPGVPIDASGVVAMLTETTRILQTFVDEVLKTPASCRVSKRTKKIGQRALRRMQAITKRLLKAAKATKVKKREKQSAKAAALLGKAKDLATAFLGQIDLSCREPVLEQVEQAQARVTCLLGSH